MTNQTRITIDTLRGTACKWTAPTIDQICAATPEGLSQSIDGDDLYFLPYQGKMLFYTLSALECSYAWAA
jgi:hypothetical protein